MRLNRQIGWALLTGAIGVFIPYTILVMIFDYPDILRNDAGIILRRFHAEGHGLIFSWLAFALLGLPLFAAYSWIGKSLQGKSVHAGLITTIGILSLVFQLIGLLRWVFVVPVLAKAYVETGDKTIQSAIEVVFMTVHQFGGVLLGEHLGQLFTVIWSMGISLIFLRNGWLPRWINYLGIVASAIYLLAQAELLATVIPGFLNWSLAGFLGSTMWLVWLILVGIQFLKMKYDKDLS